MKETFFFCDDFSLDFSFPSIKSYRKCSFESITECAEKCKKKISCVAISDSYILHYFFGPCCIGLDIYIYSRLSPQGI